MVNEKEFREALGEEIRRRRERREWSQQELADKVGIHRNTLFRYEGGADMPVIVCMRICGALGAPMIEVLEAVLPDARERIARANGLKLRETKK